MAIILSSEMTELWKFRSAFNIMNQINGVSIERRALLMELRYYDTIVVQDPSIWEDVNFTISRKDVIWKLAPQLSYADLWNVYWEEKRIITSLYTSPALPTYDAATHKIDASKQESFCMGDHVPHDDDAALDSFEFIDTESIVVHSALGVQEDVAKNSEFVREARSKVDEPKYDGECMSDQALQVDVQVSPLECSLVHALGFEDSQDPKPVVEHPIEVHIVPLMHSAGGNCSNKTCVRLKVHSFVLALEPFQDFVHIGDMFSGLLLCGLRFLATIIRRIWMVAWQLKLETSVLSRGGE